LEFHGRIDHQVKINGFRIELAEIENAIRKHPAVADVAVLGVGGLTNQKRLYAFVVSEPAAAITISALIADLIRYLPTYMIPERYWCLDRLPSTPNGKRDLAALEKISKIQTEMAYE
jgi:acyl-coenzyme A synthetase/AMP-(fatty) acid ligase